MEISLVVLLLLREFARATLTFLNSFSNFFLIIYVIMSANEWIEKQTQHLSQNCIIQGQFDCWLCSLGGGDSLYSTLTVRFLWETCKKTLYSHRFSYMIFNRVFDLSKDIHVSHICHQTRCINPHTCRMNQTMSTKTDTFVVVFCQHSVKGTSRFQIVC